MWHFHQEVYSIAACIPVLRRPIGGVARPYEGLVRGWALFRLLSGPFLILDLSLGEGEYESEVERWKP